MIYVIKSLFFNHFNAKHFIYWGFYVSLVNFYIKINLLHIIALNTILWSKLYPFGCIGKHFCTDYTQTGIFYFSSKILSSSSFKDWSHSCFCLRITSYFMLPRGQHDNRKLKSFSLLRILSLGSQTSNFGRL